MTVGVPLKLASAVTEQMKPGETVLSPGMKYKHYAPSASFVLLDGEIEDICKYVAEKAGQNASVFAFEEELEKHPEIQTVFLATDYDINYRSMVKNLSVQTTYQLYRDYLDHFRLNRGRS